MENMLLVGLEEDIVFIFMACRECPARCPALWGPVSMETWAKLLLCIMGLMHSFGLHIYREYNQLPQGMDQRHSRNKSRERGSLANIFF